MMSRDPQPSSTAEKSRFSMTAVTAIHQRREKAVARLGAISAEREAAEHGPDWRVGRLLEPGGREEQTRDGDR